MYVLYCDESNMSERQGDFLIYGGLAIASDRILALSQAIDEIRARAGVPRDFRLKFNPGPDSLSHQEFLRLKQAMVEAATTHGAKLIVYVILHDIATSPDEARRNGINAVCFHFDCLLNRWNGPGLVLIDRFNDQGNQIEAHLTEKFSVGVRGMPYAHEIRLTKIVGFHYSSVGQSHLPSIVDIVLGSLRFAINAHTRNVEKQLQTARKLLGLLEPLFWRDNGAAISELSFLFSPKVIKAPSYREQYQALKDFLGESGIETAQPITAERQY